MIKADDLAIFPIDQWIQDGVRWLALNLRPLFQAIKWPVESLLGFNDWVLHAIPFPAMLLLIGLIEVMWSAYFTIDYKDVAAFAILAIVLVFMPSGILGRPEVEKV